MYVDFEYYESSFGGTNIPEADFIRFERQARVFLDFVTFSKVQIDNTLITDTVKDCLCEMMELKQTIENDGGIKTSESVGNASISYVVEANTTENNKLLKIVKLYLGNTDLLYRGVPPTIKNSSPIFDGGYYGY